MRRIYSQSATCFGIPCFFYGDNFQNCSDRNNFLGNNILHTGSGLTFGERFWLIEPTRNFMTRINPYGFYIFGQAIFPLTTIEEGNMVETWNLAIQYARNQVRVLVGTEFLRLKLASGPAVELDDLLSEILKHEPSYCFNRRDILSIRQATSKLQDVLNAELGASDTYIISPKGAFSTTELLENGEAILPATIIAKLPDSVISDIRAGAKAFALELSTAAGFHFLRAVEGAVRHFYDVLSNGAARPTRGPMGAYIDQLSNLGGDPELLGILKQIKNAHRDPVSHPEKELSMEEAQVVMGIMQSAIFAISRVVSAVATPAASSTAVLASQASP